MKNRLTHYAIHIDNMERAKKFYESVFEWSFKDYGQKDFVQIFSDNTNQAELIGALQSRSYSVIPEKIVGLEGTIAVDSIDKTIEDVVNAGGTILMPKTEIPYVGSIAKFRDTEGNLLCAMEYKKPG